MKKCRFLIMTLLLTLTMTVSVFAEDLDTTKYFKFGFDNFALGMDEKNDLIIYCDGWIYLVTGNESNEYYDTCQCYKNNNWVPWQGNWAALSSLSDWLTYDYNWTSEEISKLDTLGLKYAATAQILLSENEFSQIDCDIMCGNDNVDDSSAMAKMAWVMNQYKSLFLNDSFWTEDGYFNRDMDDPYNENRLPLLSFKVSQKYTVADVGGTVKYKFEWSASEHSIYANNPNKYKIQMIASANLSASTVLGTTTVNAKDIRAVNEDCCVNVDDDIPIYKEAYTFLDRDAYTALCKTQNISPTDWGVNAYYFLFIRIIEPETKKCSVWKVYKCQGRMVSPCDFVVDEEGNSHEINESDKDKDAPDTDASYDSDPSTDASKSSSSAFYSDGAELSAQMLLNNLEGIIETLKGVPELMEKVFFWMPGYLVTLIVTSIGLIVIVGFVKLFLH